MGSSLAGRSEGEPTVVGFINAISDGLATAFLPWLEVLPDYQGRGIGRELTKRMLAELADLYSIDLTCDPELAPYYQAMGWPWASPNCRAWGCGIGNSLIDCPRPASTARTADVRADGPTGLVGCARLQPRPRAYNDITLGARPATVGADPGT
jgi:hypothetical protein